MSDLAFDITGIIAAIISALGLVGATVLGVRQRIKSGIQDAEIRLRADLLENNKYLRDELRAMHEAHKSCEARLAVLENEMRKME
jgi:hypothetical protein